MKFQDFIIPEYKKLISKRYKLRQQGKKVPLSYDLKIKSKDGSVKDLWISAGIVKYNGKIATMAIIESNLSHVSINI